MRQKRSLRVLIFIFSSVFIGEVYGAKNQWPYEAKIRFEGLKRRASDYQRHREENQIFEKRREAAATHYIEAQKKYREKREKVRQNYIVARSQIKPQSAEKLFEEYLRQETKRRERYNEERLKYIKQRNFIEGELQRYHAIDPYEELGIERNPFQKEELKEKEP